MLKVIKSNIQARYASLLEGTNQVSLFSDHHTQCNALYLAQHQSYTHVIKENEKVLLSVFQGSGEVQVRNHEKVLHLQIMNGDIFSIPDLISYTILNTSHQRLIIAETIIKESKL